MRLTDYERDRLLITVAADVARRRRDRGLKLNYPEAVAMLTAFVLESARDGRTVVELMSAGCEVLTTEDVLPGVAELVDSVQVEATFADGTKLVTLHSPVRGAAPPAHTVISGEVLSVDGVIALNADRDTIQLTVEYQSARDARDVTGPPDRARPTDRISGRSRWLNCPGPVTPSSTDRPSAIASGWLTPTCSSRSPRTARVGPAEGR